jgi:AcrR family transcriptional regulator
MTDAPRRRSSILDAADRLLRHYGPQKTTVADVAREAGVGVGTVYLEFPSKESIVEELSRARHAAVLGAMQSAATADGRTCAEQLTGALDARLEALIAIAGEGAHACDLVHCVSSAVKSAQAAFHAKEHALLADVLRRGSAAGELEVDDIDGAARTVLRAYASFTLPWLRDRDPADARAGIAAMHRLVLHGVLRRSPRGRARKA